MVTLQGASLFRHFTRSGDLEQIASLYRATKLPEIEPSLHHLCGLRHRAIIADKFATSLVTHAMSQRARVSPPDLLKQPRSIVTLRLTVIRLRPYFYLLYHFFETLRAIWVDLSKTQRSKGKDYTEKAIHATKLWVVDCYAPEARTIVFRLWAQVMRLVNRKLRPASYATKVERAIRGWNHPPASPKDILDLLVFGGLGALYRVIRVKGYASRMRIFDKMVPYVRTASEDSKEDEMAMLFGVMPRLPEQPTVFIHYCMDMDEPMSIISGEEPPEAPLTPEEQESELGTLTPLSADCTKHEMELIARREGKTKPFRQWFEQSTTSTRARKVF